jgi:sulfite reductase alpha subunit-like flavoprotein
MTTSSPSLAPIIVGFLSQTGTAAGVAESVHETLAALCAPLDRPCMLLPADRLAAECPWSEQPVVLLAAATAQDGGAPDHALRFVRWLKRDKETDLSGARFAVLALGDSSHGDSFCKCGKDIDKILATRCGNGGRFVTSARREKEKKKCEVPVFFFFFFPVFFPFFSPRT